MIFLSKIFFSVWNDAYIKNTNGEKRDFPQKRHVPFYPWPTTMGVKLFRISFFPVWIHQYCNRIHQKFQLRFCSNICGNSNSYLLEFLPHCAIIWLHQQGRRYQGNRKGGGTVFCMGFYADISWESRCNIKTNIWAHFYKILLVFEVTSESRKKIPSTLVIHYCAWYLF